MLDNPHRNNPDRFFAKHGTVTEHSTTLVHDLSEDELALRFAAEYKDELRYVATQSRWMKWNGTRWVADGTLFAYDCVRNMIRRDVRAQQLISETRQKKSVLTNASTVAAVEKLARADRRLAAGSGSMGSGFDVS